VDSGTILGPVGGETSPIGGVTNPVDVAEQQGAEQSESDQSDQGDSSDDKGDNGKVDPSLRLINTAPVSLDQSIDEPVTSGGDVVIGETPGGGN
jgi:hypothetical protein